MLKKNIKNKNKIIPRQPFVFAKRTNEQSMDRFKYIRMDKNERVDSFPKYFYKQVFRQIEKSRFEIYPNENFLKFLIAKKFNIKIDNILLTPGSDMAIKYIFSTYINPDDKVAFLEPTYAMINYYASLYQCKITKINFNDNINIEEKEAKKFFNKNLKAIFIANPNQPTGTLLPNAFLKKLLDFAKKHNIILVIDEAYVDFSKKKSSIHLVDKFSNLIITRTFSKAYGLAGIRLGFIVSQKQNILHLNKSRSLSDLSLLAIKAGEKILENFNLVKKNIKEINNSKSIIKDFCKKNKLYFISSNTNFIHIKFKNEKICNRIYEYFLKNKILIRINNNNSLPAVINCSIRVSLGSLKITKLFLLYLKKFLKNNDH